MIEGHRDAQAVAVRERQALADVVYDPWIDQVPLRLYDGEKLAARIRDEGADLLIVESDFVNGPVLKTVAWTVAVVIMGLNAWLLFGTFRE